MLKLHDILEFAKCMNAFSSVTRMCYKPGTEKRENDVEHSYSLAMLAWYIAVHTDSKLDSNLVIKYALIHDLVEVYAGDTFLYSKNQLAHDTKKEREEEARIRIEKEFPLFTDLHTTILNYEKREDRESHFVYVLDKLHPVFQLYLDNGRIWKEEGVTLDMLLAKKKDKLVLYPELLPYWEELEALLREKEDALFCK